MTLLLPLLLAVAAQEPAPSQATVVQEQAAPTRIQWFGTLEQGLAEAKRTNRPIMMSAAAPSCGGIAGEW